VTLDDDLLTTSCLPDLRLGDICHRGPRPLLNDSEVPTLAVLDQSLGADQGAQRFWYFCRHRASAKPGVSRSHRTTFVR
jgi:hypothetical protein